MTPPQHLAILAVGAAAAFAIFLVHRNNTKPREASLQRTRSVRRPRLDTAPAPGTIEGFGPSIDLDAAHIFSPAQLRAVASVHRRDASVEDVENAIYCYYDTLISNLLKKHLPDLVTPDEIESITSSLSSSVTDSETAHSVQAALERHLPAFTGIIHPAQPSLEESEVRLNALYEVSKKRARNGMIHRSTRCASCSETPIRGVRWHCANCPDVDLCSFCKVTESHNAAHVFYEIRIPAPFLEVPVQAPIYPGSPHDTFPILGYPLDSEIRKSLEVTRRELKDDYGLDSERVNLLWHQFTALATPSPDGKNEGRIDRKTFDRTFLPMSGTSAISEKIPARLFAYYDNDGDGMIGFRDFAVGVRTLEVNDLGQRLSIAFKGYDDDGNGYISRKDCLAMLMAHFDVEMRATQHYVNSISVPTQLRQPQYMNIINSSGPLASAFPYYPSETRPLPPITDNVPAAVGTGVNIGANGIGTESLYRIAQRGFKDLLDTIFHGAENLAEEASKTREERRERPARSNPDIYQVRGKCTVEASRRGAVYHINDVIDKLSQIEIPTDCCDTKDSLRVQCEQLLNEAELNVVDSTIAERASRAVGAPRRAHDIRSTHLIRCAFRREWLDAVVDVVFGHDSHHRDPESPRLLVTLDHLFGDDVQDMRIHPDIQYEAKSNHSLFIYCVGRKLSADKRLVIQHRPQPSDMEFTSNPAKENNLAGIILSRGRRDHLSPFRDALLDIHDDIDEQSVERGGPGRISLEELMQLRGHVDLEFLTCWLYVTF